ncbi:MAG: hypothetical protein ACYTAN_08085 [Planctomycetota bacterium]|jgi:hypothetical protein
MRHVKKVAEFMLSHAKTAVAALVLLGLLVGYWYNKDALRAQQERTRKLEREIFECDPAEAWRKAEADYVAAAAVQDEYIEENDVGRPRRERAAPPKIKPSPTHVKARSESPARKRKKTVERAPVETARAAPVGLVKAIHADHNQRLNRMMDQMH